MLCMGCVWSSVAQNAKDDFLKINQAYQKHTVLHMKMKYEVYKNEQSITPLQTELGEVKLNGSSKYTKISNIETLENNDYTMIVDGNDRHISLLKKKIEKNSPAINTDLMKMNLEKLLEQCEKVEYKKEAGNKSSYLLLMPAGEYSRVKIIFNSSTFLIEKMVLYYSQKENLEALEGAEKEAPRLEITYYEVNTRPAFTSKEFAVENYLQKESGKWKGKGMYAGYTVYDSMNN